MYSPRAPYKNRSWPLLLHRILSGVTELSPVTVQLDVIARWVSVARKSDIVLIQPVFAVSIVEKIGADRLYLEDGKFERRTKREKGERGRRGGGGAEAGAPEYGLHRRYSPPLVGVATQMLRAAVFQSAVVETNSTEHADLEDLR